MTETPALAVGGILGDSDGESRRWGAAVGRLSMRLRPQTADVATPLAVEVVFHVDGRLVPNEFVGVRTGRYERARSRLAVQVAVVPPDAPSSDTFKDDVLVAGVRTALDEAERFAAHRRIAPSLDALRGVVAALEQDATRDLP